MGIILLCSVQNYKMIWQLSNKLWANKITQHSMCFGQISYIATVPWTLTVFNHTCILPWDTITAAMVTHNHSCRRDFSVWREIQTLPPRCVGEICSKYLPNEPCMPTKQSKTCRLRWIHNMAEVYLMFLSPFHTLGHEHNGWHFADNNFKCIFLNGNHCSLIQIPLRFVPMSPIGIKTTMVQVMAWCQTGKKPSTVPMLTKINDTTRAQQATVS